MSTLGRIHRRVNSTQAAETAVAIEDQHRAHAVYEGLAVSAGSWLLILLRESRP